MKNGLIDDRKKGGLEALRNRPSTIHDVYYCETNIIFVTSFVLARGG